MQLKFHQVPIGSPFTFRGQTFTKTALSMAEDENRIGNIFQQDTDVEADAMNANPAAGFPKREF